jgi:cobalamin biosynthesis protein CobT
LYIFILTINLEDNEQDQGEDNEQAEKEANEQAEKEANEQAEKEANEQAEKEANEQAEKEVNEQAGKNDNKAGKVRRPKRVARARKGNNYNCYLVSIGFLHLNVN